MYRRHFLASLAALPVLLCSRPLSAQTQPLRLGIMPFNTPLSLMRAHQALRDSLATQLRRNVEIGTSADYITFLNDSLDARFDLLITGPHFGVMSMEKGYEPLFHYRAKLVPVFVVRTESNLHDPQKLRGKLIALSSRLSISSVGGLRWLEQHGLKVGRDIGVIEKPTHGAAIAAVAVGEADAALTTYTPLRQAPDDVRQRVRTLETDIAIPHLITMAHRRLGKPMVANIRKALLNFEASAEGKAFFTQTGYLGYDVLTSEDIDTLRPYVELVRKLIREGR